MIGGEFNLRNFNDTLETSPMHSYVCMWNAKNISTIYFISTCPLPLYTDLHTQQSATHTQTYCCGSSKDLVKH